MKRRKKTIKTSSNHESHWATYRQLQQKVDEAWARLEADVQKNASPEILMRDKNHLLLLLGECNYMANECMRFAQAQKTQKM